MPRRVTYAAAALEMQCSVSTVARYVREGVLRAEQDGKAKFVLLPDERILSIRGRKRELAHGGEPLPSNRGVERELRDRIAYLERQLDEANRRNAELFESVSKLLDRSLRP